MTHCVRCNRPLEILRHPVRRLWGTRYWLQGVRSLLAKPLRLCPACGAIHTWEGELLAAGAAETADELRLKAYRSDMVRLRDGFGGVVIAAELAVIWMSASTTAFPAIAPILAIATGGLALFPFAYFSRKAREAKLEVKRLREARVKGQLSA
ncbi:MAG: hypothetical protein HYW52_04125 [Gemmatimonadetes bacterium]|nr:hypothetical protein [Gemmatimonadota bacterium]MBI2614862.1 hypothetical protein [Gemmatimonadota bacterium]